MDTNNNNRMKLDIHTHILPGSLPDLKQRYGYPGWINIRKSVDNPCQAHMYKDDTFFRAVGQNCWCLKERSRDMQRTNVDVQVLSTVPVMFNYWAKPEHTADLSRMLNDDLALQIREHSEQQKHQQDLHEQTADKSFYGFGTLPMQAPHLAAEEMTRCMRDLHFKGIQIGTHINEWNLDEKKLYPIWKRAEELDCPIFVHPWDMDHICRTDKYWLPWLVGMPTESCIAIVSLMMGNVLTLFPKLKFCFAHGGGSFPFTFGRIQHGYDVRPDLCATECAIPPKDFLGRFYTDSLVHSHKSLDLLIDVIGEDRIILGSDYPFPLGETTTGKLVESSDLDERIKEKILYKNGMEFIGLNN